MKKALLQMHLAVLLWGFTGVLGKAISVMAPVLVWYRMLITFILIGIIIYFRKQWVPINKKNLLMLFIIGSLISLHWVAFYASIQTANISVALVCLSTAGVFTSIFDPFVNKGKHNIWEVLLGLLAIAGVYLIYHFQISFGLGIAFGVVAAILSSFFTILNKSISTKYPARTMVFYEMGAGWLFLTILFPLILIYLPSMNLLPRTTNLFSSKWYQNDWLWIVILSLCCTVWAQSLALNALKKLSSFTATLSVNLEPIYGILLAFLFYNENQEIIFLKGTKTLNLGFIAGMSLILLSVILQMTYILKSSRYFSKK